MDIETTKRLAFLASRGRFQESSDSLGPTDQNSTPPATTTAPSVSSGYYNFIFIFKEVFFEIPIFFANVEFQSIFEFLLCLT